MWSKAHQRQLRAVVSLFVCVLWPLVGCAPRQAAPPGPLRADFNAVAASDGRTVIWWLRMSGPDFAVMVHQSTGKPQFGSVNDLVHQKVATMIVEGLIQHGLALCSPNYRTIAVMKDGAVQFTGTCTLHTDVDLDISSNGS